MKCQQTLILSFFILVFAPSIAVAQSTASIINDIRNKYHHIQTQLPEFHIKQIPIFDESTEGGEARAFFDDQQDIKCIEVIWFGESGRKIVTYYFEKAQLFFAYEQHISYNRPIYWDESLAQEVGDQEIFDPKKSKITENLYYFQHGQLIHWLKDTDQTMNLSEVINTQIGQDIVHHATEM